MDGGPPHQFPPRLEHAYAVRDGRIETRSLEAHIVDHCNLTCDQCCSLSPFLPRWLASPESLAAELARAAAVLAPRVFKLVGGEPLLHPRIVDCLEVARASGIAPALSITTHGFLLERADDAFWRAVDALTISLYPDPVLPAASVAAITARAERWGVTLNWKRQDHFVRMTRDARTDDAAETAAIYDRCWLRERCHMLRDGVFYTCTRPPHFQSYFRGRIDFSADGIRLHAGDGLRDELLAYLAREQPLDACAHCFGGNATLEPHRLLSRAEVTAVRSTLGVIVAVRDPFGFQRIHYDVHGRAHAPSIRALYDTLADLPRTLDLPAIAAHLDGAPIADRTVFAEIRAVPPGHALRADAGTFTVSPQPPATQPGDFTQLLRSAIAEALASGRRCAVALSGGLDSAVVLALCRALGGAGVPAYVLAARIGDYCELDGALATAKRLGAEVVVVEATADDLRRALPDTIRHVEVPLYNPHPVAKLLLARALARDGIELVLSGDGADHVMGRDDSADYLPLVSALFDAAGVELRSPFLDSRVVSHLLAVPPDPDKQALRRLAATLPISEQLVEGRKVSRLAPPIDLSGLVPEGAIATLAQLLGRARPSLDDDRERVRWTTLALLVDAFGAWP